MEKPNKKDKALTLKQKKFCELYTGDREFFGNGVQSYIEAYNINLKKPNAYKTALSCARGNLIKPHILAYINELLENLALNEAHVDKQIAFLITQNADFGSKLGAIKEYNALKARIKNKLAISGADDSPLQITLTVQNGEKA